MGQAKSKDVSNTSHLRLKAFPTTATTMATATSTSTKTQKGQLGTNAPTDCLTTPAIVITRPAPRTELTRLSTTIDPIELVARPESAGCSQPACTLSNPGTILVQSPSGNLLDAREYQNHPKRPLTLRERKEKIMEAMEKEKGAEKAQQGVENEEVGSEGKKSAGFWGCCCSGRKK